MSKGKRVGYPNHKQPKSKPVTLPAEAQLPKEFLEDGEGFVHLVNSSQGVIATGHAETFCKKVQCFEPDGLKPTERKVVTCLECFKVAMIPYGVKFKVKGNGGKV